MISFIIILYFFIFVLISTYFLLKSIIILTRKIFIHGSSQSQRESYRAFFIMKPCFMVKWAGASAHWSRRRPKRASTFSLVKRFFFLREKEMVQTPIISKIIYIIWGHIQRKALIFNISTQSYNQIIYWTYYHHSILYIFIFRYINL